MIFLIVCTMMPENKDLSTYLCQNQTSIKTYINVDNGQIFSQNLKDFARNPKDFVRNLKDF